MNSINSHQNVSPIASAINVLRGEIDRIDDQILGLLEQRYRQVSRIARVKDVSTSHTLAMRPAREQRIVERLSAKARHVPADDIGQIWRSMMALSARHQRPYRVLLWGPEGARTALATLAAARHGAAVTATWATSVEAARAEALRGEAILIVSADEECWRERGGLDLIARHPTGCDEHPWALELGRVERPGGEPAAPSSSPDGMMPTLGKGVVACLGGRGSFSEAACLKLLPGHELLPLGDMEAVLRAVREGSADLAVVPVANSHAGSIEEHRRLLTHPELRIIGEHVMEVRQHLLGQPGACVGDVRRVTSHPAALSQCEAYLAKQAWARTEAASTALAAAQVAGTGDPAWAAIGSEVAAEIHGLGILERDLQGETVNETRFVIVERRHSYA
ncbi:prephenate dehydratase domain-containing protein [Sphingomonas sp. LHG3443-2]|uniref:prephenate dehydratase domain-containing protein n=1 Tax=Sphingomonas sp. LHG3443-2 TaxID=2804639 RepID=UPI003CF3C49C